MKRHFTFRALGLALTASLLPTFAACASQDIAASDLMKDIKPQTANAAPADLNDEQAAALSSFGLRLLQETDSGQGNILVSPLSVESALGMTANGAQGNTLSQMEEAFGLPLNELNAGMATYLQALQPVTSTEEQSSQDENPLKLANSIWIRDGFTVEQDFLQTNANYYHAGAFEAPFNATTVTDINRWVSAHTDSMIEEIVDDVPASAMLYLVNALAFDDAWATPYEDTQVMDGIFTAQDGSSQDAKLMYSTENIFLEGTNATGFIKQYQNPSYAFAALLPNEGTSVDDLIASLDGATLHNMLMNSEYTPVDAAVPQFESEYGTELNKPLAALGIQDAFDPNVANLAGISPAGELYLSSVLHKTFISVDAKGTKAAAATSVEIRVTSAAPSADEPKVVHLDRPFVYFIIDTNTNAPVFAGITRSIA